MNPTPEQSIVLFSGFLQQEKAQNIEEESKALQGIAESLVITPISSDPRCLCLWCYQKIGFSQEPGLRALNDSKSALEESLEEFEKQWIKSQKDRQWKIFRSRNCFDTLKHGATFEDLVDEINKAIDQWKDSKKSFAGEVVGFFHSICGHLNGYKNLLEVIPQNSIYTSVFCGVTKIIIQASVNHENMCYGFTRGLKEITDEIVSVEKNSIMEQDLRTRALACDIYAQFFVFYKKVLDWFSDRSVVRGFKSFNQDLSGELSESISDVKRIASLLTRHHQLKCGEIMIEMEKVTHRELKEIKRLSILNARQQNRMIGQNSFLIDEAKAIHQAVDMLSKLLIHMLGEDSKTEEFWRKVALFKRRCGYVLDEPYDSTGDEKDSDDFSNPEDDQKVVHAHPVGFSNSNSEKKKLYHCRELQLWSREMEDFIIQDNWAFISTLEYQNPRLSHSTLQTLQGWVSSLTSKILWISKDFAIRYPSPLSVVSANLVQMAVDLQLSVCAFFCSWPDDYEGENLQDKESACVVDFLYTLIRQVIDQLPEQVEVEAACNFSLERFLVLSHPEHEDTWEMGLEILKDLLTCFPQPLFIVLDGIDHLDQTSISDLAAEILCIFGEVISEKAESGNVDNADESNLMSNFPLRVLFTTAADCDMLSDLQDSLKDTCVEHVVEEHDVKRRRGTEFLL